MAPIINFSGLASGIDSNSLIQALLDRERSVRIKPLEDQVTRLTDENSAFDQLSELLEKLKDKVQKFRDVNGGILARTASSSDETVASVSASNGTSNTNFSLNVSQLAKNGTHSFDDRFSSSSTAIAPSLTNTGNNSIQVQIGTGSSQETVNLSVTNSTTLDDLVTQFNNTSTKGVASIVNTGTESAPSYAMVIAGNSEGTQNGQIAVNVGSDITTAGIFSSATLSQAQNAEFTVSGLNGTITRSSNSIADVFSGLTINLNKTGTTNITVAADAETSSGYMQEFVDAFNEVVNFVKENDLVTREENGDEVTNIFGPLADSSLDEQVLTALRSALSGSSNSSGNSVKILSDLGITTKQDGTLDFNVDTFEEAVSKDPDSLATIAATLGENLGSVNGTISKFTQFNGLIDGVTNANQSTISNVNSRLADLEKALAKEQQSLTSRFAKLESLVGQLQSQQSALSSLF